MIARYGAQDAIVGVAGMAAEALGGMCFISSPEVAYLVAAAHCVKFHPPSRISTERGLAASFSGDVLRIG